MTLSNWKSLSVATSEATVVNLYCYLPPVEGESVREVFEHAFVDPPKDTACYFDADCFRPWVYMSARKASSNLLRPKAPAQRASCERKVAALIRCAFCKSIQAS